MLRNRFRSMLILIFALILIAPGTSRADTISILSQTYRIEGSGETYVIGATNETVLYDETSNTPLSRIDNHFVPGGALSPSGFFRIDNLATGGGSSTTAFVSTGSGTNDAGHGIAFYARASASITFMPLETQLLVKSGVRFAINGLTTIYDETSGAMILSTTFGVGPNYTLSSDVDQFVIPFQLDHIYTMTASTSVCCLLSRVANLSISSVPESGTSFMFILFGMLGLLFCRRSYARSSSNSSTRPTACV